MESRSWSCTLAIQFFLCLTFFLAINIGHPQGKIVYRGRIGGTKHDLYFISVRGGFRPLLEQNHLLKQIGKVTKAYKVQFVVNISELGDNDLLTQNATLKLPSLRVPWYTTRTSNEQGSDYFLKEIKVSHGKIMDIIGLNTASIQDLMLKGPKGGTKNNQLHWLTRTLEASNSSWRIVVGFHQLAVCEESKKQMKGKLDYGPLQRIFLKFGVNAYLSSDDCTDYSREQSIAFNENPGSTVKGHRFSAAYGQYISRKMDNGFLLHRVGSLDFVTYFVTASGEVVHRSVLHQKGKEAM